MRPAMDHPRIKRDPNVMMGKPVVVGTRLTVEHILRLLGAGDSWTTYCAIIRS